MFIRQIARVIIFLAFIFTVCPQSTQAGALQALTATTYRTQLLHPTLIYFHVDGCVRCDSVLEQFTQANDIFQAEHRDLASMNPATTSASNPTFYMVNCSVEDQEPLCLEYNIEGFPTILAVKYPHYYEEYTGSRTADHIYRFYKYLFLLPPLHPLTTPTQYSTFSTTDLADDFVKGVLHVPTVVYSGDNSSSPQKLFFQTVFEQLLVTSGEYRNIGAFGLYNKTDSSNTFTFEIIRKFDSPKLQFEITDGIELATVLSSEWKKAILPLFGIITPQNYQYYLLRELPIVWVFYDVSSTSQKNLQLTQDFIQLASKFHDHLLFVKIDSVLYGTHAINFGLQKGQIPGIVIENRFQRKNYIYPVGRDTDFDSIDNWLSEYASQNLSAVLRSEEYAKYNLTSPVKHVIGSQYDNFISKTHGKDVVVLFYATWCSFTPQLRSILEELILSKLQDDTNLVFAEVDVSLNDVPSVTITETPMIYVFPSGIKPDEQPLQYGGSIDIESIFQFIAQVRKSTPISLSPLSSSTATATTTPKTDIGDDNLDTNLNSNTNHKDEL